MTMVRPYSSKQIAEIYGISVNLIYDAYTTGALHACMHSGISRFFDPSEVDRWYETLPHRSRFPEQKRKFRTNKAAD